MGADHEAKVYVRACLASPDAPRARALVFQDDRQRNRGMQIARWLRHPVGACRSGCSSRQRVQFQRYRTRKIWLPFVRLIPKPIAELILVKKLCEFKGFEILLYQGQCSVPPFFRTIVHTPIPKKSVTRLRVGAGINLTAQYSRPSCVEGSSFSCLAPRSLLPQSGYVQKRSFSGSAKE